MRRKVTLALRAPAALAVGTLALILGSCAGEREEPSEDERLNLILISLDTMRADRLSFYGETERETTPVLDKLAAESAVFSDALATSTVTGPSHLSMFTGQYPHRHGLLKNGGKVAPKYTLASTLSDAGWQTAGFTGGGYLRELFGLSYGFETYRAKGGPLAQFKRTFETSMPHALEWLKSRPAGPFFLFLHGYDPHCPYEASPEGLRQFGGKLHGPFDPEGLCGEEHFLPRLQAGDFSDEDSSYLRDLYDALVYSADQSLKPLIFYLRKSGLLEKSILVFTSDHGEGLGEHGWIGHGKLWGEQARVPLFIRFPKGRWAGRFDTPVSLVDLVPTLLEELGVPAPDGVQGESLIPLVRAEVNSIADPSKRMRLVSFDTEEAVWFGSRWKLSLDRSTQAEMLFDLDADPGELVNLFGEEAGADRFGRLHATYRAWREETAASDAAYFIARGAPKLDAEEEAELSGLGYGDGDPDADDE